MYTYKSIIITQKCYFYKIEKHKIKSNYNLLKQTHIVIINFVYYYRKL